LNRAQFIACCGLRIAKNAPQIGDDLVSLDCAHVTLTPMMALVARVLITVARRSICTTSISAARSCRWSRDRRAHAGGNQPPGGFPHSLTRYTIRARTAGRARARPRGPITSRAARGGTKCYTAYRSVTQRLRGTPPPSMAILDGMDGGGPPRAQPAPGRLVQSWRPRRVRPVRRRLLARHRWREPWLPAYDKDA